MDNTQKLLIELCGALGFEVITHLDYDEKDVEEVQISHINRHGSDRVMCSDYGFLIRNDDGSYRSRLKDPIVSYELKPK